MSIVNGRLFVGDGSRANVVGQMDPAFDGSNGVIRCSVLNGVVNTPNGIGGVVHGPALTSNGSVRLNAGDNISFDWKATGGQDAYDVVAYIVDMKTGETELLLDKTGGAPDTPEFYSDWSTQNHTIEKSGDYKFSFVSGSWDATGRRAAGANLYIDNIKIQVNTPIEFSADQIASARSNMGAVMNQLEFALDGASGFVVNSEASRSHIEDANYAQASTVLATIQIKLQSATAVLAQANLSSEMALKLLEKK